MYNTVDAPIINGFKLETPFIFVTLTLEIRVLEKYWTILFEQYLILNFVTVKYKNQCSILGTSFVYKYIYAKV